MLTLIPLSLFSVFIVASVALQAEMDECHQRLLSGEIHFAAVVAGNCGHQGAKEMAISPFIEAYKTELYCISEALRNLHQSVELAAAALLKDADGLSRRNMQADALAKELAEIKRDATSLQGRVIRLKQVTRRNADELTRIALEADSMLGTAAHAEAERYFVKEPWADDVISGNIVILLSDIFSILRDIENTKKEKDGKGWVAPDSFERGMFIFVDICPMLNMIHCVLTFMSLSISYHKVLGFG